MEGPNEKRPITVNFVMQKANICLQTLRDPSDPEFDSAQDELHKLIWSLCKQPAGNVTEFHNFAVILDRNGATDLACDVLRSGLSIFPKNCDLLSDFLQYGMVCGFRKECAHYYETLSKIPKRCYTWRSFAFSIHYLANLLEECEQEAQFDAITDKMQKLSDEFLHYLPYDEEAYRSRAELFRTLRMPNDEVKALRDALRFLNSAPKCALQLADILVERGEYDEALSVIPRGISDNNGNQSLINEEYLYYLMGRAKTGRAERSGKPLDEETVLDIYSDFNTSLSTMENPSYKQMICNKVVLLQSKTGIDVPMKFEHLFFLVS